MAEKRTVQLVCDFTGEPGETVNFGLDGENYEMELSPVLAAGLRDKLKPFVERGRKVAPESGQLRRSVTRTSQPTSKEKKDYYRAVREWARNQESPLPVSDRGRISADVLAAYEYAHNGNGSDAKASEPEPEAPQQNGPETAPQQTHTGGDVYVHHAAPAEVVAHEPEFSSVF